MEDNLSLLQGIYSQAKSELGKTPKKWPLIVNQPVLDFFLSEYEKETGNTAMPDENGVYLIYGNEVALYGHWDE